MVIFKALNMVPLYRTAHTHLPTLEEKSDTLDYSLFFLSYAVPGFKDSLHTVRKSVPAVLVLTEPQVWLFLQFKGFLYTFFIS